MRYIELHKEGYFGRYKNDIKLVHLGFKYAFECKFVASNYNEETGGYTVVDEKHKWLRKNMRSNGDGRRYEFLQMPGYFRGSKYKAGLIPEDWQKAGVVFRDKEDAMAFKLAFDE